MVRDQPLRINLGSGHDRYPGWTGYDRSRVPMLTRSRIARSVLALARRTGAGGAERLLRWPADTRVCDLTKGIPHETGSVDAVYSSHFLEHLERNDGVTLLRECHRVLRPGGTLRLVVPDLKVVVGAYQRGDRNLLPSAAQATADAFQEALDLRPARRGNSVARAVRRIMRTDDGGHKWLYDEESLSMHLRDAGFPEPRRVRFGEGRDVEAAKLDSRSPFHLHFEAFKPLDSSQPADAHVST